MAIYNHRLSNLRNLLHAVAIFQVSAVNVYNCEGLRRLAGERSRVDGFAIVLAPMSSETEALRSLFSKLAKRLKPDDIVDELFETKLLTQAEYEGLIKDISQQSDLRGVNRRILMAVINGPQGSVNTFVEVLRASQSDLASEIQKGKN